MIIGLIGQSCAGKNKAADLLERQGAQVIDLDRLGHQVLDELAEEAGRLFGKNILTPEGSVDRRVLGPIVFSDPEKLGVLERLLHPRMAEIAEERLKDASFGVINGAVLYKMGLDRLCSHILWIEAPFLIRFLRARKRDSASFKALWQRFRSQSKITLRPEEKSVDIVTVHNWGSLNRLNRQLTKLLHQWRKSV